MSFDETIQDRRHRTSTETRDTRGMIRWVAIKLTSDPEWQVVGHRLFDGRTKETSHPFNFSGIGFYARPKAGRNVEGIMAHIGGAQNPVLIATRDEDTRNQVAKIAEDETIMFNTVVMATCKSSGECWICPPGGTPRKLAFADELNDLRAFVLQQFTPPGHTHTVSGSVTTAVVPVLAPVLAPAVPYPGTVTLKAT